MLGKAWQLSLGSFVENDNYPVRGGGSHTCSGHVKMDRGQSIEAEFLTCIKALLSHKIIDELSIKAISTEFFLSFEPVYPNQVTNKYIGLA